MNSIKQKPLQWPQDFYNIKCILFSIYIGLMYWFLPRSIISLLLIGIFNYGIINWYNHMYECKLPNVAYTASYIISISLLLGYLPRKNKIVLAFSLYVPYFIMAWYDYLTQCSFRMNPTIFPFGRFIYLPMKPPPYKQRYNTLDPMVKQNIAHVDKFFVVSLTAMALIYGIIKYIV